MSAIEWEKAHVCDEIEIDPDNHYTTHNYILFNRYTICRTLRKQSSHEMNRCMQACMQLTTLMEYLNKCWLVFVSLKRSKRCLQEDMADCWSFTQFCWFMCFDEKGSSWWIKSAWISSRALSIKKNLDNQKIKFESKIAKIRKSNYPYGMCVCTSYVPCVQVSRSKKCLCIDWMAK